MKTVLRLWRDSPVPVLRTGFQALRKAALAFAYLLPGRWEEIGYPGPLGARADAPAPGSSRSRPRTGSSSSATSASSARGPAAAWRPRCSRRPGLDVVVLEAGGYWSERDFDGAERAGLRRLYRGGGAAATDDQGVGADRRRLPRRRHGRQLHDLLPHAGRRAGGVGGLGFPSASSGRASTRSASRLGVNTDHNRPSRRDEAMARGLGRSAGTSTRCRATSRLRAGRRLRLMRLWLPARREAVDAADVARGRRRRRRADRRRCEGAARARRAGRRPASRRARPRPGQVRARGRRGRGRDRDPGVAAPLRPDEPERRPRTCGCTRRRRSSGSSRRRSGPWEGTLQALYSDQFRFLDGGYGVKLETVPLHPALLTAALPWEGARRMPG